MNGYGMVACGFLTRCWFLECFSDSTHDLTRSEDVEDVTEQHEAIRYFQIF